MLLVFLQDAAPGTTIFRDAKAHDDDKSGDGNDLFSYSILPGPFSVGIICYQHELDVKIHNQFSDIDSY